MTEQPDKAGDLIDSLIAKREELQSALEQWPFLAPNQVSMGHVSEVDFRSFIGSILSVVKQIEDILIMLNTPKQN